MKNIFVAYSLLLFAVVGCGENNTGYSNANNCQPGTSWNGSACVQNGLNGINNGTLPNQGCAAGSGWNGNTCVPLNNGQLNPQVGVAGVNQVAMVPAQNCPAGQYFNGANCAVTVNYQGSCGNGQINTFSYGCAQTAIQCEHGYSYLSGSSCLPAPIVVSSCKSRQVRRNGRVVILRNGCPNDCSGNYGGTPRKIKYKKDGSIKKIKW